jgi:hypothetical protein
MLLAGLILGLATAAYAGPVKVTGDVSVKYEKDTTAGEPDSSAMIYSLTLMGEADLGSGWSLYARLGTQGLSHPGLGDFNTDYYGEDEETIVALDQFGLIFKDEKLTYKLGRQDATVGTTALLYCRTDLGRKAFVDGLSVAGTIGKTEVSALLAQEDNLDGTSKNKVYAIRTGFSPKENFNWGLTLGRYQDSINGSTNHWAIDGTVTFDKNSVTGEYTQSNRNTDNKAYAITWNYEYNDKTAFYVTGFRVEAQGDMGGQSDFDNGNRGWYYGMTHKLSEDADMEIVYKDQRDIGSGLKNTKLEMVLSYSF